MSTEADGGNPDARSGQRIVVTGGSGRIGRYVLRELARDYEVVNADLIPGEDSHRYIRADVTDLVTVRAALAGADSVIHLAGRDLTPGLPEDEYIQVNPIGTW